MAVEWTILTRLLHLPDEEQSYLLNATFLSPEEEEDYALPENITYNHVGGSRYHRHQVRNQVSTPTGGQIIDNHVDVSPPPPTAMGLPAEITGSSGKSYVEQSKLEKG